MRKLSPRLYSAIFISLSLLAFLAACQPLADSGVPVAEASGSNPNATPGSESLGGLVGTPVPTRPAYNPGELVAYQAQTGDTLPALASHFNTTVAEILAANPIIPESAKTLPQGLPMQIPIYYRSLWGSAFQIMPDSLFINGPAQIDFDTAAFLSQSAGWLNGHTDYAAGQNRAAAEIVDLVALNFSLSPQLLLALLEYRSGALSQPVPDGVSITYPLGNNDRSRRGLYLQLVWAADLLNDGYYRWRNGSLTEFELLDGRLERPDPWQNAATVSLQYFFASQDPPQDYAFAISPAGFAATYNISFGDPWADPVPHIPGSLEQPELILPFEPGRTWALTGGPHTAWGQGEPWAALDFAPPSVAGGCERSEEWATAAAPGVVVRSEPGTVVLDLDADGDERTGWVLFYFHVGTEGRVPAGATLSAGDRIGHPSCEGGRATGTHIHIARKYNGEWVRADGPLAFNLGGWVADTGAAAYRGSMQRFERTITACLCANQESQLTRQQE